MSEAAERIDLSSPAFKRDPLPGFQRLCAEGPLVRARLPLVGQVRLVTRHAEVMELLKDSQRFVVDARNAGRGRFDAISVPIPRTLRRLAENMLGVDDPDHRRLRNLVERAFRRRAVGDMNAPIEQICDRLLEPLDAAGAGTVDFIEAFARQLPLAAICELLGLPERDRPRFLRWAGGLTNVSGLWGMLRALPGLARLTRYLRAEFSLRRSEPAEGLITALVEEEEAGRGLSEDELLAMVFLLLLAGHETTTNLLGGGLLALLQHPEQGAWLAQEPARIDTAVEELLRFVTPVQMTKPRYATGPTRLGGASIARGELCLPLLGAANVDPRVFQRPEQLELGRDPNPHLSFGSGVHSCLGLQLARAEARIAFRRLLPRLPAMQLAIPEQQLRWTSRLGMRALRSLPVQLG